MNIAEIPVGGYLSFGQFLRNGELRPTNLLWRKASEQNEFFVSNGIGKFYADAQEPENASRCRRERGSNFFPQTNICQFLNSDKDDWFEPQHDTDTVAPYMKKHPGFLRLFEQWEREMIVPQEIVTSVPKGFKRQYGEQAKTLLRISMMSRSQLIGGDDLTEGAQLELFATTRTVPLNLLTRSSIGTGLYAIDFRGHFVNRCPASEYNITPLVRLNGDCAVEFSIGDDWYTILPPKEITKAITDELHLLLK